MNRAGEAIRTCHVREREVVLGCIEVDDLVAVADRGQGKARWNCR